MNQIVRDFNEPSKMNIWAINMFPYEERGQKLNMEKTCQPAIKAKKGKNLHDLQPIKSGPN